MRWAKQKINNERKTFSVFNSFGVFSFFFFDFFFWVSLLLMLSMFEHGEARLWFKAAVYVRTNAYFVVLFPHHFFFAPFQNSFVSFELLKLFFAHLDVDASWTVHRQHIRTKKQHQLQQKKFICCPLHLIDLKTTKWNNSFFERFSFALHPKSTRHSICLHSFHRSFFNSFLCFSFLFLSQYF